MRGQQLAIWDDQLASSLEETAFPQPASQSTGPDAVQECRNTGLPAGRPEVGEVVRWKGSAFGCRKGTTGRVKDMVSRDDGPALVIQSIWGGDITVSAKEYHYFFESCDPQDPAYAYWESA